jgi:hypothetical protein
MEYENCPKESSMFGLSDRVVGAVVILLVLLVLWYVFMQPREKFEDRADEIMTALDNTMKEKGNIVDFKRTIQDPKFSPTKYIYLADLYRQGKLTKESVNKALDDASI